MYEVSQEYKDKIYSNERHMLLKLDITTRGGQVISLLPEGNDIIDLKYSSDGSNSERLCFGYTSACSFSLTLNNVDKNWSAIDFTRAVIKPFVGLQLANSIEYVPLGVFDVESIDKDSGKISLSAIDRMILFDKEILLKEDTTKPLVFPMSVKELLVEMCSQAGLIFATSVFLNSDFVIESREWIRGCSIRKLLAYIGEICGCFSVINYKGELELKWFDTKNIVDTLSSSEMYTYKKYDVETLTYLDVNTYVKYDTKKGLYGIEVKSNKLLENCNSDKVLTVIDGLFANKIKDVTFIPGSISSQSNPALQIGDVIKVIDLDGTEGIGFVTSLSFANASNMSIVSAGKSITENRGFQGDVATTLANEVGKDNSGIPEQKGHNGATLKTNGSSMYWSGAESTVVSINPVNGEVLIDCSLENATYLITNPGSSLKVTLFNVNSLAPNESKDIILLFSPSSQVSLTWDNLIKPNDLKIINAEANRINEFMIRCYRPLGTNWLLTRQVF